MNKSIFISLHLPRQMSAIFMVCCGNGGPPATEPPEDDTTFIAAPALARTVGFRASQSCSTGGWPGHYNGPLLLSGWLRPLEPPQPPINPNSQEAGPIHPPDPFPPISSPNSPPPDPWAHRNRHCETLDVSTYASPSIPIVPLSSPDHLLFL